MQTDWRNEERNYNSDIKFLTRLIITLTSDHDYRSNLDNALKMIGTYCQNDRVHIIKIYPDMTFTLLHEWHKPSLPSIKNKIKKQKCFFEQELEDQLNTHNYIYIRHASDLNCKELKCFLEDCNIEESLLFPLFSGYLFSFLSFSHCTCQNSWNKDDIELFTAFSAIIAANLEKNFIFKKMNYKLKQANQLTAQLTANRL